MMPAGRMTSTADRAVAGKVEKVAEDGDVWVRARPACRPACNHVRWQCPGCGYHGKCTHAAACNCAETGLVLMARNGHVTAVTLTEEIIP
jgi:hypothetical protein